MKFDNSQERLIKSTAPYTIGISKAGAGKTSCIVERINFLHYERKIPYNEMVVITFTNAMAEELLERLNSPADLRISTVHSYCNYLLLSGGISTSSILDKEEFDKLFPLIKKHPEVVRPVTHLLLDEANDSTPDQFEFILDIIKPKEWTFVGDPAQEIYGFNGSDAGALLDLSKREDVSTIVLRNNYRNGEAILNYARTIIHPLGPDYYDHSFPCAPWSGYVYEKAYTKEEFLDTVIQKAGPRFYGEWFILCRTNIEVNQFIELCGERNIPCTTFKQSELSTSEIQNKLNEQCVKILTMHSSKGLESDRVAVWNPMPKRSEEERRLCYVAATRARKQLWWIRAKSSKKKKQKVKTFDWE